MRDANKKRLRRVTIIYWVLLLYIVAALVWWFYSLEAQSKEMYALKKKNLEFIKTDTATYNRQLFAIEDQRRRNSFKHESEGLFFLILITIGAVFIYRAVRRQFQVQQQQQNFMMAVTHELKTPIAVSRLNLETMQKHQLPEEKKARLVKTTLQETLRLDTLINNILLSSQLEANAYKMQHERLEFSKLVCDVVAAFRTRYPEREVKVDVAEALVVEGDALLLNLLVSNLLENANKYSPRSKPVSVQLARPQRHVVLQVADEGSGIEDNEKEAVFEKFYRIGNEATRKAKGTGLGLWLCRKIAQDHGAVIRIKDNNPAGSIFIVQF
jgi:two-component system, OmpR family, sensor histidine kinase CiaH